jgi:hypothetical protein
VQQALDALLRDLDQLTVEDFWGQYDVAGPDAARAPLSTAMPVRGKVTRTPVVEPLT